MHQLYSHFYGLVPHDDISGQNEGLYVDDVCVPTLCADVQPFALKGKVAKRDPGERETEEERDWVLEREQPWSRFVFEDKWM